jgi:hypothetical protein
MGVGVDASGAIDRLPRPWHHKADAPTFHHSGRDEPDDDSCVDPGTASPPPTIATPPPGSVTQSLAVSVPPIVRVQSVDDRTVTVVTNATRQPAIGDQVYVRQADGGYVPAGAALVDQVMSAKWPRETSWCSTTAEHTGRRHT